VLASSLSPEHLISTFGLIGLFAIIFAESGLLIGFFLPGDSLLFVAGAVAAGVLEKEIPDVNFNIWVVLIGVFIAAVVGDQVGYLFGSKVGPALFRRPDSKLFRQEYVDKAQEFFDRNGPKAIVMARFVPIVRTFCPVVAGIGKMPYRTFVRYNVIGGLLWAVGVTLLGYFFGQIGAVKNNIEIAIIGVIAISLIPMVVEYVRHRRAKSQAPEQSSSVTD
jgi:membrane-associated protein